MQKKPRYYWIDLLKVFSIFGVVFIHSCADSTLSLVSYYFRFCVPIFIITSFFLVERAQSSKSVEISPLNFWKQRIPRLVLPFLIWSSFYTILNLQANYPSFLSWITRHWIGYGWSGQYYLIVLIQLIIIYPWLRKIHVTPRLLLAVGFISFLFLYLPFSYLPLANASIISKLRELPSIYWIFYVLFAIYTARHYESIRHKLAKIATNNRFSLALAILLWPCLLIFEEIVLRAFDVNSQPYFRLSIMVVSCFIFLMFIKLDILLESQPLRPWTGIRDVITWLSSWTLGVFCLNPLVISILYSFHILDFHPSYNLGIFIYIFNSLVIYCIAVLMSWTISFLGAKALVK